MKSQRVELSEQVTTPTILICNETIKIWSSCKRFSTVQCIQIREHCYIYVRLRNDLYMGR